ncbi:MAG: DALR domain-containing protein, partial [Rhodospirillaceae bacterium]
SLGNIVTVRELLEKHRGEAIRLALLSAHYRQPLDWSDDTVFQAHRRLDGLYDFLDEVGDAGDEDLAPPKAFMDALYDDLNIPKALAVLSEMVEGGAKKKDAGKTRNELRAAGALLGILQDNPDTWLRAGPDRDEIDQFVAEREAARASKDFQRADNIRNTLKERGVEVRDRPNAPPRWLRKVATDA